MAEEKKKMSVAEILAAARKADAGKATGDAAQPAASEPAAEAPADSSAAQAPAEKEAPKPAAAKPGGARPSVSDILAAARAQKGEKKDGEAAPAAKAPAAPAKKETPKPAAAKAKDAGPVTAAATKDTTSILAAAHSAVKPGPMTKAEAAQRAPAAPAPPKPSKPRIPVPPMPAKPEYAKPKPPAAKDESRRAFLSGVLLGSFLGVGFTSLTMTLGLWTLGTARFMFPNVLMEPPSTFKVGFPSNFAPGQVETKFVPQYGVWIVNYEYNGQPQIYALRTVCTHLGCTPNWLEGEQKFKCPCHGSGFYKDGINFEGPAPRPLERYAIRLADDGQLEVDKSKLFQEEIGQWSDSASFVPV